MILEHELNRSVAAIVPRDVVVVTGPEAAAYLHGQISADVAGLNVGSCVLSFLLEPRGQVEGFFSLCRTGTETYLADTESGFGETIATSLNRFKLRTRAEITFHSWQMLAVRGPVSPGEPPPTVSTAGPAEAPEHLVRPTNWPKAGGYDVLAGTENVVRAHASSASEVSGDEFDALRMAYGLPAMGAEIQPGDIPNETGVVEQAASFTKGCYRGQELVERIDSRTGGRRSVRRFRMDAPIAAGDELHDVEGDAVGTVLSAATLGGTMVGFARVRRDAAEGAYLASGDRVQLAELF